MPAFGAKSVVCQGRSRLEIAEELKSLNFCVQSACMLLSNLKINLVVSFGCVRKICYLFVLLVQTVLYRDVLQDRRCELSLAPSDVGKEGSLLCLLQSDKVC